MNLGEKFASHIDHAEFDDASQLIAEDCLYRHETTTHKGRKGIIAMYRELQDGMKKHFDSVKYSSEVEVIDGETCRVQFIDEYRKGDLSHTTRSEEILYFKEGLITQIEHISPKGEAEAFRKFWMKVRG